MFGCAMVDVVDVALEEDGDGGEAVVVACDVG